MPATHLESTRNTGPSTVLATRWDPNAKTNAANGGNAGAPELPG